MSHHLPVAGSADLPLRFIGARFETPEALLVAVASLRAAGIGAYNAYTPYPVHGLAEAMRVPKSVLSFLVLGGGVTAVLIALSMELVPSALIYPITVGGKPVDFSGLPQYVPIIVALTLMISAIVAVKGMILLGGMPRLNHPMLAWDLFAREASRGFFLSVEARDAKFTVSGVTELLGNAGATDLAAIHEEEETK